MFGRLGQFALFCRFSGFFLRMLCAVGQGPQRLEKRDDRSVGQVSCCIW
jgi:hypothetical protein